jgi:hypothetical protein
MLLNKLVEEKEDNYLPILHYVTRYFTYHVSLGGGVMFRNKQFLFDLGTMTPVYYVPALNVPKLIF